MAEPDRSPEVLSYASIESDSLEEFNAEAEGLIDSGFKPEELRQLFKSTGETARYYAKSMRRRFSTAKIGETCVVCGVHESRHAIGLFWQLRVRPRRGEMEWDMRANMAGFRTNHAMCMRCAERISHPFLRAFRVNYASRWAVRFMYVVVAACFAAVIFKLPQTRALSYLNLVAIGLYFCAVIITKLLYWKARRNLPNEFYRSVSPWAKLIGVVEFWDRDVTRSDRNQS